MRGRVLLLSLAFPLGIQFVNSLLNVVALQPCHFRRWWNIVMQQKLPLTLEILLGRVNASRHIVCLFSHELTLPT